MQTLNTTWPLANPAMGVTFRSDQKRTHRVRIGDMKAAIEVFVEGDRAQQVYLEYERVSGVLLDAGDFVERGFIAACRRLLSGRVGPSLSRIILADIFHDKIRSLASLRKRSFESPHTTDIDMSRMLERLEHIDVGVALFDEHLELALWNQRALEILDFPDALAMGRRPLAALVRILAERGDLGSGEVEEPDAGHAARLHKRNPWCKATYRAGGRLVEASGRSLLNGGVVVTLKDVTERRNAEVALSDLHDHLHDLVRERTEQLELAKQRADEASNAKSLLLAGLSHEIRTPLNGILGFVQILQAEHGLSRQQSKGLSVIRSCGEHLLSLANSILDVSRMEATCKGLSLKPVDLPRFLQTIVETASVLAEAKGLRIRHEVSIDASCSVLLDEVRLRQVLFNLLGNAIKFTSVGEVVFRARLIHRCALSLNVAFEVIDTGPGIPANGIERVFLPFEQLGDSNARGDGAGLGLHISRHLVRLMGGDIRLDSKLGAGSTFSFAVQMKSCDEPDASP
jgi:signal transduction histidine kinase